MRLSIPTEKTFRFKSVTDAAGVLSIARMQDDEAFDPLNCFRIGFRQATRSEAELRTGLLNKRSFRMEDDGQMSVINNVNPDELVRLEIFSTLCECTLEYPVVLRGRDGEERVEYRSLEFVQVGSVKRVRDRASFDTWFGLLFDQFTEEIYKACLEVNPQWDTTKS